ncbi:hypothetical protein, partial [Acidiphilium sp.]
MAGILTETARRVIPEREDDGEAAGWARAGASGGVRRRGVKGVRLSGQAGAGGARGRRGGRGCGPVRAGRCG